MNDLIYRATGLNSSAAIKVPVACATTANIVLAGLLVIDTIQTTEGMRVLVKNQTDASENGIYNASVGAWERAADMNASGQVKAGTRVWVNYGGVNGGLEFVQTAVDDIEVSTDDMVWERSLDVQGVGGTTDPVYQTSATISKDSDTLLVGPQLKLRRLGTMLADTILSEMLFQFENSIGTLIDGGGIDAKLLDPAAGSEDMILRFRSIIAGTLATRFNIGNGMFAESLTDPGAGKMNVLDLLINNESLQRKAVWTPAIKFGGNSVGVTGTQTGFYTRIGRVVFAEFSIVLTSKGSSVGAATISGLPFTVSGAAGNMARTYGGWSGLANVILVSPDTGTTSIALKEGAADSDDLLANTHATNTTSIYGQVTYTTNDV